MFLWFLLIVAIVLIISFLITSIIICPLEAAAQVSDESTALVPSLVLTETHHTQLKAMLDRLVTVCTAHNVTLFAVKRTLLAAVRDHELPRWHTCCEMAILHDDLPKLVSLRNELEATLHGAALSLTQHRHGYRLSTKNFQRYPVIYIDVLKESNFELAICTPLDELSMCSFADSHLRRTEIFTTEHIFPLQKVPFGDIEIYIAAAPEHCLNKLYGSNGWRDRLVEAEQPRRLFNDASYSLLSRCMGF